LPWIFSRHRNTKCPPSTTGMGRKFTTARLALIIARNQSSQSVPLSAKWVPAEKMPTGPMRFV
jgi:hypothetical protein